MKCQFYRKKLILLGSKITVTWEETDFHVPKINGIHSQPLGSVSLPGAGMFISYYHTSCAHFQMELK